MKWNPMEDAPRDGSPVVLLYNDFSGVIGARWGEENGCGEDGIPGSGWFYLDYSQEIGELSTDLLLIDYEFADSLFAGWVAIPEPAKEAVPGGASCQPSEQHRLETTPNDERKD